MKSRIIFLLVVGVIFFAAIVFAQFSEYVPTKNNKDVYRKASAGSVVTKFYENAADRWSEAKSEIMPIKIEDNGDDVIVTLSLVSVADVLTFNQDFTPDNRLEYRWEVKIDTDNNTSTGDHSGYDTAISLTHFKPPGSLPFQGTILDGTQKNTWILSETGGQYGHEIEATLNYETKSIVMVAQKSWEELMDLDANDRFSFNAYYRPIDGGVQDVTSASQPGSNIVFDPAGDVDYSFIDIVSGKVEGYIQSFEPFTFIHFTDVHMGWKGTECVNSSNNSTPEECSSVTAFSIFTETLQDIIDLGLTPDFILISGDNVECSNEYYFNQFLLSFRKTFRERLGYQVPFYHVPGNHDRYEHSPGMEFPPRTGNDHLNQYYISMGRPDRYYDVNIFPGFQSYNPPSSASDEGLDWYNYSFEHNGYFFIGLDSGSDLGIDIDMKPEGKGLHHDQIIALYDFEQTEPKIIFMHHPIYTGTIDNQRLCENESIFNNRELFITYCQENNVRLVLSGHTHRDHRFDKDGTIFMQTPSAVKGDDRGYRIIDVIDANTVNPHPYTSTAGKSKKDMYFACPGKINVIDSQGRQTGYGSAIVDIPNSYYSGYYDPSTPQIIVLYDVNESYKYQINGSDEGSYILNIRSIDNGNTNVFAANYIHIEADEVHQYTVDWPTLSQGGEGVTIKIDSDGDGTFEQTTTKGPVYEYEPVIINKKVKPVIYDVSWDPSTSIFALDVALENKRRSALYPRIKVVINKIAPPQSAVTINNPDGGGNGIGAYWEYSNMVGADNLFSSGEISESKTWEFHNPRGVGFHFSFDIYAVLPSSLSLAEKAVEKQTVTFYANVKKQEIERVENVKNEPELQLPTEFVLEQNYPNPFNALTTINYQIPKSTHVTLKVINMAGQEVVTLVDQYKEAGYYDIEWNSENATSGIYLYILNSGEYQSVNKLILMK